MTLLHHHHKVPFEDTPGAETTWLWDQRKDLLGLVEQQRKELARLERDNYHLRRQIDALVQAAKKRWWQR